MENNYFLNKRNFKIYTRQWIPENMKAGIILIHGYGQHSGNYELIAEKFSNNYYGIYTLDLQGHGKSEGDRAYIDNFNDFIEDIELYVITIQKINKEMPLFLLGHSMGGNIAIQIANKHPDKFKAVYLSAPMIQINSYKTNYIITILIQLLSYIIPKVIVSSEVIGYKKLTRNVEMINKYESDNLMYNEGIKMKMAYNLFCACSEVQKLNRNIDFPLMIGYGFNDYVCCIKSIDNFYNNVPSKLKQIIKYDDLYHEILFEPESDKVIIDIIKFFNSFL